MARKAIVTLNIGNRPEGALSKPFFYRYCERHQLDFIVIHEARLGLTPNRRRPRLGIHLEKFQLAELFEHYERIAYVDSDVLIHPEAPDIFDQVEAEEIGCVYENFGKDAWKRTEEWQKAEALLGPLPGSPRYFNAGVLVFGRSHQKLFDPSLGIPGGRWPDQTFLNYHSRKLGMPVVGLDKKFNFLPLFPGWDVPQVRAQKCFVHYAGRENKVKMQDDAQSLLGVSAGDF